jgi:DNA polymerase III subunit delta'
VPLRDIANQPRAVAILAGALKNDRVSHAYLFAGPEGADKEGCARAFVQALACERVSPDACGACDGCRRVAAGSHPDVTWILSEVERLERKLIGRSDLEGAPSREIKIGQIRELQSRLSLTPLVMRRKAAVIVDADRMTAPAQNALLKVLEEPPAGSTLILISSAPDVLLPTVRSRCTRISFAPPTLRAVAEAIGRERKLDPEAATLVARLSGGNSRLAAGITPKELEFRKQVVVAIDELPRDARMALRLGEEFGESRDGAETVLEIATSWFHDVAVAASSESDARSASVHVDMADRAVAAGKRFGAMEALRRYDLCVEALDAISRNGSPRLHLEHALLRMVYP